MSKDLKIVGLVVLVLLFIGLILLLGRQAEPTRVDQPGADVNLAPEGFIDQTPEAREATDLLLDELIADPTAIEMIPVAGEFIPAEPTPGEVMPAVIDPVTGEIIPGAIIPPTPGEMAPREIKTVIVAPGTSPIDIGTGQVVTPQGGAVDLGAEAGSMLAPQQSFPVDPADLPGATIRLLATSASFTPNEFTVNRGQVVSLAVSNVNESTFSIIFRFEEPALSAVVIGLAQGETRTITFNAPNQAGSYVFYNSMFDHRLLGSEGVMIVR